MQILSTPKPRRSINLAVAQMGPVQRSEARANIVRRLVALLRDAAARGCSLVVFPEAALGPFFPHWNIEGEDELDAYFDDQMPNPTVDLLFEEARRLSIGFYLGFAERVVDTTGTRRFNTSILVDRNGSIIGKYRKIHLPGYTEAQEGFPFQDLEPKYFLPGDLGFPIFEAWNSRIGMCICNDRRWPETYRAMRRQYAELILLGYNTPLHNPARPDNDFLAGFHNHLCMQAGAYQNSIWIAAAAKAGYEEGVYQIAGSCIIAPTGQLVASTISDNDEIITAVCDLDLVKDLRQHSRRSPLGANFP